MAEAFKNESTNIESSQEQSWDILEWLKNDLKSQIQDELLLGYALKDLWKIDNKDIDEVNTFKSNINTFNKIEGSILKYQKWNEEWFLEYIFSEPNKKEYILSLIKWASNKKLKKYTKTNGYIINDETFISFEKRFHKEDLSLKYANAAENIANTAENVANATENVAIATENVINEKQIFELIFTDKILKELDWEFKDAIRDILDWNNNSNSKVLELLEKDDKLLTKILDLLSADEDTTKYKAFTDYLRNSSDTLALKIQEYEDKPEKDKVEEKPTPLRETQVNALIGKNNTINGSRIEWKDDDGNDVFVDTGEIPPIRKIALNGSDYRMETDVPIWDFYEAIAKYESAKLKLDVQKKDLDKSLWALETSLEKTDSRLEELEELEKLWLWMEEEDEQEIKNLRLEKKEIETKIWEVKEKLSELEWDYERIANQYKIDLEEKVDAYREMMELKDKETKQTLKFLSQTWFDIHPQTLTDQIIREFKWNQFLIPWIDLNPQNIDLKDSRFWEKPNEFWKEWLWDVWKENLVKFMEKAMYGEVGWKDSVFNWIDVTKSFNINPTEINHELEKSGVKTWSGWDINQMRDNLKKVKEETITDDFWNEYPKDSAG